MLLFAAVSAAIATHPPIARAGTVSWKVDQSGAWESALNWSGGFLPGPGDDVVINQPTISDQIILSQRKLVSQQPVEQR